MLQRISVLQNFFFNAFGVKEDSRKVGKSRWGSDYGIFEIICCLDVGLVLEVGSEKKHSPGVFTWTHRNSGQGRFGAKMSLYC